MSYNYLLIRILLFKLIKVSQILPQLNNNNCFYRFQKPEASFYHRFRQTVQYRMRFQW